jgi:hypothetical protein
METGPANTVSYMVGGYAVIFGVILIYLASLVLRQRNLKQDERLLAEIDQEKESEAGGSSTARMT